MAEWQTVRLSKIVSTNQSTYSPKEDWQFANYLDTGNITMNQIDEIDLLKLVSDLKKSKRIFVYGHGHARTLCTYI